MPVAIGAGIGAGWGASLADSKMNHQIDFALAGMAIGAAGGLIWPVSLTAILTYKILTRKGNQAN